MPGKVGALALGACLVTALPAQAGLGALGKLRALKPAAKRWVRDVRLGVAISRREAKLDRLVRRTQKHVDRARKQLRAVGQDVTVPVHAVEPGLQRDLVAALFKRERGLPDAAPGSRGERKAKRIYDQVERHLAALPSRELSHWGGAEADATGIWVGPRAVPDLVNTLRHEQEHVSSRAKGRQYGAAEEVRAERAGAHGEGRLGLPLSRHMGLATPPTSDYPRDRLSAANIVGYMTGVRAGIRDAGGAQLDGRKRRLVDAYLKEYRKTLEWQRGFALTLDTIDTSDAKSDPKPTLLERARDYGIAARGKLVRQLRSVRTHEQAARAGAYDAWLSLPALDGARKIGGL
jgi:hypothetical protein